MLNLAKSESGISLVRPEIQKVSKAKGQLYIAALILLAIMLTSCGGKSVALPDPNIKVYLLDLTGSGDVENQFRFYEILMYF